MKDNLEDFFDTLDDLRKLGWNLLFIKGEGEKCLKNC